MTPREPLETRAMAGTLSASAARLLVGAAGTAQLKGVHALLTFLLSIFLARTLGTSSYGDYSYAVALVTLLGLPTEAGLPILLVRSVSVYRTRGEWGLLRGIFSRAHQFVAITSLGIVAGVLVVVGLFSDHLGEIGQLLQLAVLLVPLHGFANLRSATLRGLLHVVRGQFPELFVQPVLFGGLLAIAYWTVATGEMSSSVAMSLRVATATVVVAVGVALLVQKMPREVRGVEPRYETAAWMRSAGSFFFLSSLLFVSTQTDIVMLGMIRESSEVGVYRVAATAAQLCVLIAVAVNDVIAPMIAQLYEEQDREKLQWIVTLGARISFFVTLPVAVVLMVAGAPILRLFFGEAYAAGALALAILCGGQLVNSGTGSVATILNMTGHESTSVRILVVSGVANIGLNAILIPRYGIEGAAIATAMSLVMWNVLLAIMVHRKTALSPTVLGGRWSTRSG